MFAGLINQAKSAASHLSFGCGTLRHRVGNYPLGIGLHSLLFGDLFLVLLDAEQCRDARVLRTRLASIAFLV